MYRPIVFMFSGQGSHYFQMGKGLFDNNIVFRDWMIKMDTIVARMVGCSIVDMLYNQSNKRDDVFDRMLYTHPAIFMVEYALAQLLKERGIVPDFLLGSSLGEYTAAAVSGVIELDDMLSLLVNQAELCERYCKDGGMIAILDRPEKYHACAELYENCEIASINFDSHFVVSGHIDRLRVVSEYLDKNKISFQGLPVAHAFHSSMFDAVKPAFLTVLNDIPTRTPAIPIISCASATTLEVIGPDNYWNAVRNPILFQQTILEIEKKHTAIYLDLGPSGTLSTFVKYVLPGNTDAMNLSIITPFGQEVKNLNTLEQALSDRIH